MDSHITKENQEFFEEYLQRHPAVEADDKMLFDDDRHDIKKKHEESCARLIKALLDGEIE